MNDVAASKENHAKLFDNATWIPLLFLRPKRTIHEVVQRTKSVWQLPLLVLSVLILVLALVSAPIKKMAIEMGTNLPPDFQYYSPEMQAQFMEAQASQTSPLFLYVFPILFGILGIWVTWFITASILHLVITLYGSRASNTKSYNLTAWAMLPIALRLILQIIAVIATKQQVSAPGLSGFLTADTQGLTAYLRAILALVGDQTTFWFVWMERDLCCIDHHPDRAPAERLARTAVFGFQWAIPDRFIFLLLKLWIWNRWNDERKRLYQNYRLT